MKRREVLTSLSAIGGGVMILPQVLLSGCHQAPYSYALFDWGDNEILNEMADMIIPDTPGVPGAKAANVGDFIQLYISDCFAPENQTHFLSGYNQFKLDVREAHGEPFDALAAGGKQTVIAGLEDEAKSFDAGLVSGQLPHFYSSLKRLVMFGYSTSEIGATKALNYVPIPGKQIGIMPYNGEKAYAL